MKRISAAAVTVTGRRKNNQDNFMLSGRFADLLHDTFAHRYQGTSDRPFLAAVCDGMGGESAGERASFLGCETLAETAGGLCDDFSANKALVAEGVLRANDRVCETVLRERTGRMGSTVVAALIQNDRLYYTNLGDSRLYFLRGGKLTQMTRDHTEGQMMVDAGVLTKEQLKTHASGNKLNRYLGIPREEMRLTCPVYDEVELLPGDRLLIVSDGVSGALDELDMSAVLSGEIPTDAKAQRLVDLAYENGSRDNMTALVIEIEEAPKAIPAGNAVRAQSAPTRKQPPESARRYPASAIIVIVLLAVMVAALSIALLAVLTGRSAKDEQGPDSSPAPGVTDAAEDEQGPSASPETSDEDPTDAEQKPDGNEAPDAPETGESDN